MRPWASKRDAKYVDLTPTWRGILPLLLEAYHNGTSDAARNSAKAELFRLADMMDDVIAKNKARLKRIEDGGDQ